MTGELLHGGPEKLRHETVKAKPPGLHWGPQDGGGARAAGCLPARELHTGSKTTLLQRCVLHSAKLKEQRHLGSLTSDMEPQDVGFQASSIQCFLTMVPLHPFGMVMLIRCHSILELCNLV